MGWGGGWGAFHLHALRRVFNHCKVAYSMCLPYKPMRVFR